MKPVQFKVGTATVEIVNPECIPLAQKRIADLVIRMTKEDIEKREKERIQKGKEFIYNLLKDQGILPLIERERI